MLLDLSYVNYLRAYFNFKKTLIGLMGSLNHRWYLFRFGKYWRFNWEWKWRIHVCCWGFGVQCSSPKKGKEKETLTFNQPQKSAIDFQSMNVKPKTSVVMKTALTMNLLTLFITLNVLPQQFINIIYKNCNNSKASFWFNYKCWCK